VVKRERIRGHASIWVVRIERFARRTRGTLLQPCRTDFQDRSDDLLPARLARLTAAGDVEETKPSVSRRQGFKGLGKMDAEELWETTLDPPKRTLVRKLDGQREMALLQ
jgi:DNA gyrase/topoisomerase IV subunit B